MMSTDPEFEFIADVADEIALPAAGTLSRTLHNDDRVKVVLFGFAQGEELSEHTSSMPAMIHILEGEADIGLGGTTQAATAGSWIHMQPNLKHSIHAKTPVVMLLTLVKSVNS